METTKDSIIRLPLDTAIVSILGKKEDDRYREIGHFMPVKELYILMGLTSSPMLYNYMKGTSKRIEPERAWALYTHFNILIDEWLTPDELESDCTNREISLKVARRPIKDIIDEIVEIDSIEDERKMRRALKQLIARYY